MQITITFFTFWFDKWMCKDHKYCCYSQHFFSVVFWPNNHQNILKLCCLNPRRTTTSISVSEWGTIVVFQKLPLIVSPMRIVSLEMELEKKIGLLWCLSGHNCIRWIRIKNNDQEKCLGWAQGSTQSRSKAVTRHGSRIFKKGRDKEMVNWFRGFSG